MDSNNAVTYTRVRILGQLECCSPLHVGDGTEPLFKERVQGVKDAEVRYRAVCLDHRGKPFIPATTLRGWLRDRLSADPALADRLFGHLESTGGVAGKVRVFDAILMDSGSTDNPKRPYWDTQRATAIQHGIALNPITGTVGDHLLFRHEVVPPGTRFSLELTADDLDRGSLAVLLGLLESLNGAPDATIGRGRSRMQGRLKWTREQVQTLDDQAIAGWLDDADRSLAQAYKALDSVPAAVMPAPRPGYAIRLRLRPQGPLLINEPGLVSPGAECEHPAPEDAEERHDPDLEFSRTPDGRAQVPAASLRGVLRGRARRILATLAAARNPAEAPGKIADFLLEGLFGATGRRGRLWTSDAVAATPCDGLDQTFVAIDRFTGGGERHKLYRANAARCGDLLADLWLDTRISPDEDPLRGEPADWEKGLLLLLARDALEGELAAGWGKARGYGALEVELDYAGTRVGAWSAPRGQGLLERIDASRGRAAAQDWIDALHQKIATVTPAALPSAARPR